MLNVILGALLPVIVTLGLGMLVGWRRHEDTRAAEALNRMVLLYALPLALFAGTITVPRQELLRQWPLLLTLLAGPCCRSWSHSCSTASWLGAACRPPPCRRWPSGSRPLSSPVSRS